MPKIIVLTGGIGAGKSYVSKILIHLGYHVYDCDSQAKRLMISDNAVKQKLLESFGNEIYDFSGNINNKLLAAKVFSDADELRLLNSIVHPAVLHDIERWIKLHGRETILFIETAIPCESGIDKFSDAIIYVDAPEDIRVSRVLVRNNTDEESVRKRINSQSVSPQIATFIINNGEKDTLLPQILMIIEKLRATE